VVKAVEASGDGPRITELTGTQPQQKMGPLVDTALAVQLLSRVAPMLPAGHALKARADGALDKALAKLGKTQTADGRWGAGGWANSLQSSLGTVALEMAGKAGKRVPAAALERARTAQKDMVAGDGSVDASGAAGIALYALAGAGRNGAEETIEAKQLIEEAKAEGRLRMDADLTEANLRRAGASAPRATALIQAANATRAQTARLDDEDLLRGFGNNGGEEFLSYMMTSESLVIQGGEEWTKWRTKMVELLEKVQSADGSWTGHHCITSPVFCTAAVVQTVTADRDAAFLRTKAPTAK
jgi:hypothetical protein